MATTNTTDNEATNPPSVHAMSAVGGQHFIHLGAVLDIHFPTCTTSISTTGTRRSLSSDGTPQPWSTVPTSGVRGWACSMSGASWWSFSIRPLSELEYQGEKYMMELSVPSVPAVHATLFGGADEEDGAAQPPALPLPANLAQWIRPNDTPAIQEAIHSLRPPEPCDICGTPLTSELPLCRAHVPWRAIRRRCAPPPLATTWRAGSSTGALHGPSSRSSFGVAPSHLPDRTLHPTARFPATLYRCTDGRCTNPYEPCACDEGQSRQGYHAGECRHGQACSVSWRHCGFSPPRSTNIIPPTLHCLLSVGRSG